MSSLAIWLSVVLFISLVVNGMAMWYVHKLVKKFTFISQNLSDLVVVVRNYKKHLKQVYKMEMFYGDETLEYLMSHTNSLIVLLEDYDDVYSIAIPLEPSLEGEEEYDSEEDSTEEKEIPVITKENVFYAGPRRSNS